jgi:hypothetical protein
MANDPGDPLGTSCYATSCILFHRYLHRVPLTETNVWSVAMASALLASKLHENVRVVPSTIAQTFVNLYRERVHIVGCATSGDLCRQLAAHPSVSSASQVTTSDDAGEGGGTSAARRSAQHIIGSSDGERTISQSGPAYQEWIKAVIETESDLLRQLGFVVHWVPDHLAHKYLPHFLDLLWDWLDLKLSKDEVAQRSWNYCNDSYRLDLSARFRPSVVTCAAIHVALLDTFASRDQVGTSDSAQALTVEREIVIMGSKSSKAWWEHLAGPAGAEVVPLVCNALLGLQDSFDVITSDRAFVSSVSGQAFNDPGSHSWELVNG